MTFTRFVGELALVAVGVVGGTIYGTISQNKLCEAGAGRAGVGTKFQHGVRDVVRSRQEKREAAQAAKRMAKLGVRPGERSRQSTGVTKWIVEDTKVGRKYHFTDPTRAKQLAKTLEVDHPGWIVLKRV